MLELEVDLPLTDEQVAALLTNEPVWLEAAAERLAQELLGHTGATVQTARLAWV